MAPVRVPAEQVHMPACQIAPNIKRSAFTTGE